MSNDGYKEDSFFIVMAIICWLSAIAMVFLTIWSDPRWGWTGVVVFMLGWVCGFISVAIDNRYKSKGIRK